MEKRDCYGWLEEIVANGMTTISTKPECRTCEDFRECLRVSKENAKERKEQDELRKQDLIAQIIDASHMISNEIGSCLLEFLNRIYDSPVGRIVFRNFLLFCEVPSGALAHSMIIPVSTSTFDLFQASPQESDVRGTGKPKESFAINLILIQKHFSGNKKANLGLIAREVMRMFSSDREGIQRLLPALEPSEAGLLQKLNPDQRLEWLMEKWGFGVELEAFKKAIEKQG